MLIRQALSQELCRVPEVLSLRWCVLSDVGAATILKGEVPFEWPRLGFDHFRRRWMC